MITIRRLRVEVSSLYKYTPHSQVNTALMATLFSSYSAAGAAATTGGRRISRTSFRLLCCAASRSSMERNRIESKGSFNSDKASMLVEELRKNFGSGKTKSYDWRMSQLQSIAKMMDEKENDITQALFHDLAKPQLESFMAEITMVKSSCKLALKELKIWMTPEKVKTSASTKLSSAEIVPEPLGVVLVISPWNFPFMLGLDPVVGAIAAGNAVVLKPSEITPATSALFVRLFDEYLDKSAIRVVEGAVPETTALLDQKWDKIFYTGGARVGRIVMAAAVKNLTPVVLELGGKCPAVVDSNLDIQVAARRIIAGKWACNNGQVCIGVDYIITTKEFAPKLIHALRSEVKAFFGEKPMESKDMSRIVNLFHFRRLESLLDEDNVAQKIVFGGQRNQKELKIAPTILVDVHESSKIMEEEIFGPLLPIVTVEKIKESFELIRSKPKPLAAYLFTNDEKLKKEFVRNVSAGGITINDTILHITVSGLPFGGVGESGMGSYHGKFSFEAFTHKKGVLYRSFAGDTALRYPPYTLKNQKLMKALVDNNIFQVIKILLGWSKD